MTTTQGRPQPAQDEQSMVLVERAGHVATVTLNRPQRLNALTPQCLRDLGDRLTELSDDADVRVVVLTGAGRAFCAGGDADALNTGAMTEQFVRSAVVITEILHGLRPITIAAVNGACAGGGMALACAADFRIAARSAFFTTAYLQIGTTGDMGLPWNLVRLVGLSHAKQLSLLGERVTAEQAAAMGLVQALAEDADLAGEVERVATRLSGSAPLAAASLKANLNEAFDLNLSDFLDVESRRFAANTQTADAAEAVQAFIERRTPTFTSR